MGTTLISTHHRLTPCMVIPTINHHLLGKAWVPPAEVVPVNQKVACHRPMLIIRLRIGIPTRLLTLMPIILTTQCHHLHIRTIIIIMGQQVGRQRLCPRGLGEQQMIQRKRTMHPIGDRRTFGIMHLLVMKCESPHSQPGDGNQAKYLYAINFGKASIPDLIAL